MQSKIMFPDRLSENETPEAVGLGLQKVRCHVRNVSARVRLRCFQPPPIHLHLELSPNP